MKGFLSALGKLIGLFFSMFIWVLLLFGDDSNKHSGFYDEHDYYDSYDES